MPQWTQIVKTFIRRWRRFTQMERLGGGQECYMVWPVLCRMEAFPLWNAFIKMNW